MRVDLKAVRASRGLEPERTTFFGRDAEAKALRDVIARGARLVTLLGPPGAGKTRLARSLARDAASSALPRIHRSHDDAPSPPLLGFVDVTAAENPAALVSAIAWAIDLRLDASAGEAAMVSELAIHLASQGRALLVVDNFEQLVASSAWTLDAWLDAAPALQIVVTSRERLRIEGERSFDVGALDDASAIALFVDRARMVAPNVDFAAVPPDVAELVARLDRLPLAIELCASRMRVLSPRAALERLSRRFDLLRSDGPGRGRYRSLAAAIEASWELLDEAECVALMALSLFAAPFLLSDGEAAFVGPNPARTLERLCDHSLVWSRPGDDGALRFGLYESVREFAREKLTEGAAESACIQRFVEHFAAVAERIGAPVADGRELKVADAADARASFASERTNALHAFEIAIVRAPRAAVRIAVALAPLLEGLASASELRRLLDEGYRCAVLLEDDLSAYELSRIAARTSIHRQGDESRFRDAAIHQLELARKLGDPRREVIALFALSAARRWVSPPAECIAPAKEAFDLAGRIGATDLEAACRAHWAFALGLGGDLAALRDLMRRSLTAARDLPNDRARAWLLHAAGWALGEQGETRTALEALEVAVSMTRALATPLRHLALCRRITVLRARGELGLAREDLRELAEMANELDMARPVSNSRLLLEGTVALAAGDLVLARGLASSREDLFAQDRCTVDLLLGRVLHDLGELPRARDALAAAHAYVAPLDVPLAAEILAAQSLVSFEAGADDGYEALTRACQSLADCNDLPQQALFQAHRAALGRLERAADPQHAAECARAAVAQIDIAPIAQTVAYLLRVAEADDVDEALARPILLEPQSDAARRARRVAMAVRARATSGAAPPIRAAIDDPLTISDDGRLVEVGGTQIDLSRRGALRRIVVALVAVHAESPGRALSLSEMTSAGWPEERMHPDSAKSRVYTAVRTLRAMGLRDVLATRDDGYLLRPNLRLRREGRS